MRFGPKTVLPVRIQPAGARSPDRMLLVARSLMKKGLSPLSCIGADVACPRRPSNHRLRAGIVISTEEACNKRNSRGDPAMRARAFAEFLRGRAQRAGPVTKPV